MNGKRGLEVSEAVATLVGAIIGAGVFAIPYAISKAGFLIGTINLVILGIAVVLLYLYVGEFVLRTKGNHQLTGYARRYLGKTGERILLILTLFSIYAALSAYMIGGGKGLANLFQASGNLSLFSLSVPYEILFSTLFFVFCSAIIYLGIRRVEKLELIMAVGLIAIMLILSALSFNKFELSNVSYFDFNKLFVPYGVILFAITGAMAIPEVKEGLKEKKLLKKSIFLGSIIPIAVYFIFALGVVGACGIETTELAVDCLSGKFGGIVGILGNFFLLFAMATSFLIFGLAMKEMYQFDYGINRKKAWMLACIVPFIIFLLISFFVKDEKFFRILDLSGGFAMTIEGIILVMIFHKAKRHGNRKPEYSMKYHKTISFFIMLVFILGLAYTILNFLGLIKF